MYMKLKLAILSKMEPSPGEPGKTRNSDICVSGNIIKKTNK